MARFNPSWDNTDILANINNLTQTVGYRQKSVGGVWITNGFTPDNPLAKTVSTVLTPILSNNVVYEFRVQASCTENGPVTNDNGIIEQIGFSCIEPTITKTQTSSTAVLNLINTDITKATLTLRKSSDNSAVYGPTVVSRVGDSVTALATGLVANTQYYWQVVLYAQVNGVEVASSNSAYLNSVCGPYQVTTNAAPAANLIWVADQQACQKEGLFGLVRTITGLSSPGATWYDVTNNRVYFADYDDSVHGNVGWFNPDTATTSADITYSTAIQDGELYNHAFDPINRRIYFVGANTDGLLVYDIDTDTTSVVTYGTNAPYNRIALLVTTNLVYAGDGAANLVLIDRTALTVTSTVSYALLPQPTHFNLNAGFVEGNGKIYVINGNNPYIGTIGVYSPDFTVHHGEINIGAALWTNSGSVYWQSAFYDQASNRLYVGDIGSSKRIVIDCNTDTVVDTKIVGNRGGKSNVQCSWTLKPSTNELLFLFTAFNSTSDATPIKRTYLEDRTTNNYLNMYENQAYTGLSGVTGKSTVIGTNPGGFVWNGTPGAGTDGNITILSTTAGSQNSGVLITNTLKQVDANNGNTPTGSTKPNVVGQPDYIAPALNIIACPLPSGLDCPVDLVTTFAGATLEYEFAISGAVKGNTNIAKIQIFAYNTNTNATDGPPVEIAAPFTNNYFSGSFTGLGGLNYTIRIKYLNSSNVELQSC